MGDLTLTRDENNLLKQPLSDREEWQTGMPCRIRAPAAPTACCRAALDQLPLHVLLGCVWVEVLSLGHGHAAGAVLLEILLQPQTPHVPHAPAALSALCLLSARLYLPSYLK